LVQSFQYYLWNPIAKKNNIQSRYQATLTQPLQYDLQILHCETQYNSAQRRRKLQLQNRISQKKKKILKRCLKGLRKGNC
jgi:hypothetical protein